MKTDITGVKWHIDDKGTWLSVKVASPKEAKGICEGIVRDKTYTVEITPKRKKRSLNANGYMWELCEKLAEANGITKEDVYRKAIKEVGVFKDFSSLSESDAKTLRTAWEMLGTGWLTEQLDYMPDGEHIIIRCYYGSSRYNTKQMSRLIDNIIEDCIACGIETMTPAELSLLKGAWSNE